MFVQSLKMIFIDFWTTFYFPKKQFDLLCLYIFCFFHAKCYFKLDFRDVMIKISVTLISFFWIPIKFDYSITCNLPCFVILYWEKSKLVKKMFQNWIENLEILMVKKSFKKKSICTTPSKTLFDTSKSVISKYKNYRSTSPRKLFFVFCFDLSFGWRKRKEIIIL